LVANGEESAPLCFRTTEVFFTDSERRFNSHSLAISGDLGALAVSAILATFKISKFTQ